ncbi:MAG: SCO family protein [Gemmataceae bacterium]
MRVTSLLILSILVLSLGCTVKPTSPTPPAIGTVTAMEPYPAPEFSLTERSGKTITNKDLAGKVWIASFIFTRCHGPCPAITATMAKLQGELLPSRPDVRLVTFTVDPVRDTPDVLKKYATNFRADDDKWLFLTGNEEVIRPLLMKGFKINATKNPNPKEGDEFDHNTKLMVIDQQGNIRGLFDGAKRASDPDGSMFEEDQKKLKELVDRLRK